MEKEITIIVPVRNRENRIVRTLDSIYAQTYRPLALTVVDNGSTDRTRELVDRWAQTHNSDNFKVTILSEPEEGASKARNRGLKETQTEYVMFFDSDDIMESDHLQRIMSHFHAHPDTQLLHWGISLRDSDGWTSQKYSRLDSDLMAEHILHGTLATARFCVRTGIIREAGAWNETLSTWDDLELGVRLLRLTDNDKVHRLTGSPRVIADISDDSLTGPDFTSRSESMTQALDSIDNLISYDPRLNLILAARRAVLAAQYAREGSGSMARQELRKAIDGRNRRERLKLRTVYLTQRLTGNGGSALTLQLFPPEEKSIG